MDLLGECNANRTESLPEFIVLVSNVLRFGEIFTLGNTGPAEPSLL